jgi:hypothetical protein
LEKSELRKEKVILPGPVASRVSGWGNSGERPEVVRKMRLVIITGVECQLRPRHVRLVAQSSYSGLEAAYTAPHFRADLSSVRGNFHAQFLEGWTGAIPSGYSVIREQHRLSRTGKFFVPSG